MTARRPILALLIFLPMLAACRQEESVVPTVRPTSTSVPATTTATPTPTEFPTPSATATALPALEPTPISPSISAADQNLGEDGLLTFDSVTAAEPAWLVISVGTDGESGDLLGYAEVAAGFNEGVEVQVDPLQASEEMIAALHQDAGELHEFEYPGPDEPVHTGGVAVAERFSITLSFAMPSITVTDQVLAEDGLLIVEQVYSMGPAWLRIHTDESGEPGPLLGMVHLADGTSENIVVLVRWRQSSSLLYAVLYQDAGELNQMDELDDRPMLVRGEPVMTPFEVTLPTDIYVLDQPVVDGTIVVERVVTSEPGWLVVYADDEGEIGRIIGAAPLADGVNENLIVEIVEEAATRDILLLLHEDSTIGDEFDFPAADGPVRVDGRLPEPVTFRTNPGNYLITRDQQTEAAVDSDSATVIIPLVVVDVPAWVIVRTDAEGATGEIVGTVRVTAGVHRDIAVVVDGVQATETLFAALHLDAGTSELFDFPDGADIPLRYGGQEIVSPFQLIPASGG